MPSSTLPSMECPVARSLAQIGDAWRVLILRDALLGFRRFDEFELDLGIAPNILTQRLNALVADGLLTRQPYQVRPLRYEYVPTAKALEFSVIIAALTTWGTRWLSPAGASVTVVDRNTDEVLITAMVGRESQRVCAVEDMKFKPGPKAGTEILKRVARLRARQEKSS